MEDARFTCSSSRSVSFFLKTMLPVIIEHARYLLIQSVTLLKFIPDESYHLLSHISYRKH
jgi:hypothetical protein